jgi:hypothetical protein
MQCPLRFKLNPDLAGTQYAAEPNISRLVPSAMRKGQLLPFFITQAWPSVTATTCLEEGSRMFKLTTAMLQRVRSYAKESGKSASTVVNEAMETWYDLHVEVVLEEMTKRNARKRSAR